MSWVLIPAYIGASYAYIFQGQFHKHWAYRISWTLILSYDALLIATALSALSQSGFDIHRRNIAAITCSLLALEGLRCLMAQIKWDGQRISLYSTSEIPWAKNLFDFVNNTAMFLLAYTAVFSESRTYRITGLVLAAFSVMRVVIFRVFADFFGPLQKKYETLSPGLNLFVIVLDQVPRAVAYTLFFFATAELMELNIGPDIMNYGAKVSGTSAFAVNYPSTNPLADFLYFGMVTISTTGFGDILPKTGWAKLWVSSEIGFAYIILTAIVAKMLSRPSRTGQPGGYMS